MEKTQITKIVLTILILGALAAAGFAFSLFKSDSKEPVPFEGVQGDYGDAPSKVDDVAAEVVREELQVAPAGEVDKEQVREELSKPPGGGLSEAEKERIRAELRK